MTALATVLVSVGATLLAGGLSWLFAWITKKVVTGIMADLKKQVTPNGGGSLYDHAKEAKDLAQRAVDVSLATDAKVRKLEDKLDAFFLSRIP